MLEFLDEVQALDAIQKMMKGAAEAQIAVAFWGKGASKNLGLERTGLDLQIVCNLDSGACNPKEIVRLKRIANVRSDPKLHGKVYLTPHAVLIGSSNASTAGLAVEAGSDAWSEANLLTDDPQIIDKARRWFAERVKASYEVSDSDVDRAVEIWEKRRLSAPTGEKLSYDLGRAFREAPSHPAWQAVKIAIYNDRTISAEGEKEYSSKREEMELSDEWDVYEEWGDDIKAGDWIIDLPLGRKRGIFGGYCHTPTLIKTKLLTFVREERSINLNGLGRMILSRKDRTSLQAAAPALLGSKAKGEDAGRMVSLAEAIAYIDTVE